MRKARVIAEQAEEARDRTHRELIVPLRRMRSGDFLTPAIADEIRQQRQRPQ